MLIVFQIHGGPVVISVFDYDMNVNVFACFLFFASIANGGPLPNMCVGPEAFTHFLLDVDVRQSIITSGLSLNRPDNYPKSVNSMSSRPGLFYSRPYRFYNLPKSS